LTESYTSGLRALSLAYGVCARPDPTGPSGRRLGWRVASEGALTDSEGVTLRKLDPGSFDPIVARLICRRATGPGEEPDLTEPTRAWRDELRRLARGHKPLGRSALSCSISFRLVKCQVSTRSESARHA